MRNSKFVLATSLVLLAATTLSCLPSNAQSFRQKHPRRAEVLRRDKNINNQIQADKGQLGGNYNKLERQDRAIRRQEQREARANGGYITKGEQRQLNREENHLKNEVNRDHK